jgi:hypothetical protein
MTGHPVRMSVAAAFAVVVITLAATGVLAADGVASCTFTSVEGTSEDNVGTILETVVAQAPDDVWALGGRVSGPANTPWAEHWDGAAWTTAKLDLRPGSVSISSIYDAKAFSPDDVWAVGSWTGDLPFVQHWNGARWSAVEVPALVGTERILTGIDGSGPNDIWVVGQRRDLGQEHGVVLHFDGSSWTVVPPPPDAAVLHDVVMLGDRPIVGGWSIGPDGFAQAVVSERTATGAWEPADIPGDPGQNTFIFGLAAASPTDAYAVGFSNDSPDGDTPRAFHLVDGAWQDVAVGDVGGSARLVAVASDASGTVAVGQVVLGTGVSRALAVRATDGGWEQIPGSGDNPPDTLSGVAVSGGAVWAVGRGVVTGATYGVPTARVYTCAG